MIGIHHRVEQIKQEDGLSGVYKKIEIAGRTCYFSYENITDSSAEQFTQRMIKSGHWGMLEHGTVYLKRSMISDEIDEFITFYYKNPYSVIKPDGEFFYVTTNLRVLIENDRMSDLDVICEKTDKHEQVYTFIIHTDRITGESFLRHRTISEDQEKLELTVLHDTDFSFARQSTRYCDFRKDKFNNNVSFVYPTGLKMDYPEGLKVSKEDSLDLMADKSWFEQCLSSEESYYKMLEEGYDKEDARYALSFSLYSPLVMTATKDNWIKFLRLRTAKSAHKDARYVANLILKEEPELKWE